MVIVEHPNNPTNEIVLGNFLFTIQHHDHQKIPGTHFLQCIQLN